MLFCIVSKSAKMFIIGFCNVICRYNQHNFTSKSTQISLFWMKASEMVTNLKWAAILSVVLVLPFMGLEWLNRRGYQEGFPIALFGILWLLPAAFLLILTRFVGDVRAGKRIMENPISFLLKVVVLILLAWLWAGIVCDQMPCFLGVPNCD